MLPKLLQQLLQFFHLSLQFLLPVQLLLQADARVLQCGVFHLQGLQCFRSLCSGRFFSDQYLFLFSRLRRHVLQFLPQTVEFLVAADSIPDKSCALSQTATLPLLLRSLCTRRFRLFRAHRRLRVLRLLPDQILFLLPQFRRRLQRTFHRPKFLLSLPPLFAQLPVFLRIL